jgi:20S proteasome alpha/beta subunit
MSYYDTQGKYTELEALTKSIHANALTSGMLLTKEGITVFFDDPNNIESDILKVYKLANFKNIVVLITGLKGDTKYLMSVIRQITHNWYNQFSEIPSAAYISSCMADFIHMYTLRKSMRPLGGLLLVGDTNSKHVYKISIDSAYDRNNLFVVGKNSKIIEDSLRTILNQDTTKDIVQNHLQIHKVDFELTNIRVFSYNLSSYSTWKI